MFKPLITQINNALEVLYHYASCRVFMLQAYQEYTIIKLQNPELSDKAQDLLAEFVELNRKTIELVSDLNVSDHQDVDKEWHQLIKKMEKFDN